MLQALGIRDRWLRAATARLPNATPAVDMTRMLAPAGR
jgi:hypothetical protein